jgi:hypothetical protein
MEPTDKMPIERPVNRMRRTIEEILTNANGLTMQDLEKNVMKLGVSCFERPDIALSYLLYVAHCLEEQAHEAETVAEEHEANPSIDEDEFVVVDSEYIDVKVAQPLQVVVSLLKLGLELTQDHHLFPAPIDWAVLEKGEFSDLSALVGNMTGDEQRKKLKSEEIKDVQGLIAQGITLFFDWIREVSAAHPERTFFEGHALANPISCYASEGLGHQAVALVEGYLFTQTARGMLLPEEFLAFLRKLHNAFPGGVPTAHRIQAWIEVGMPEQPYPFPHDFHEQVVGSLDLVVLYIRTRAHLNPDEPTAEECLGEALARYLSWNGNRIGKACLRLCYAAMEHANVVPLTELLERLFGDGLKSP